MKNKTIVLAALVSLIGFAQTGTAEAGPNVARPGTSRQTRAPRTRAARPSNAPQETDVRCYIQGFADEQGTNPIQRNTTLVNPERLWIRFRVKNGGQLPAKAFKNALSVSVDGKSRMQEEYVLDILPRFTATSGMMEIDMRHADTKLYVALETDTDDIIPDYRPQNDRCTYSLEVQKLH